MIRLLIGITLSETGGSQRVVYNILSGLPEDLYDVTLLTSPGGELLDWIADLNEKRTNKVKVIAVSCLKRDISIFYDISAFFRILSVMLRNKFNIAHFHNSKMGLLGRLAARITGIPKVYYTVHGWGLNRETAGGLYGILSFFERNLARLTTEVVFVSQSDMETGIRNRWAHRAKCRLIFNGISDVQQGYAGIRANLEIAAEMPVIAFVGRLAEPKDPMFAINVSGHLKALGLEHRLAIIGDGPLRDRCMQLTEERGLLQQVVLLGNRNDVRTLLQEANIFCLFSKWEGSPISIIEAMYAGLPVVASNVSGISELVEDHKTGYLLDGLDEEKAVSLLAVLIKDRMLRQAMGAAGREAAMERFSLDGMVSGYRQLYEGLYNRKSVEEV